MKKIFLLFCMFASLSLWAKESNCTRDFVLIESSVLIESLKKERFSDGDIEIILKSVSSAKIVTDRDTGGLKRTANCGGIDNDCDGVSEKSCGGGGGRTIGAGTVVDIIN